MTTFLSIRKCVSRRGRERSRAPPTSLEHVPECKTLRRYNTLYVNKIHFNTGSLCSSPPISTLVASISYFRHSDTYHSLQFHHLQPVLDCMHVQYAVASSASTYAVFCFAKPSISSLQVSASWRRWFVYRGVKKETASEVVQLRASFSVLGDSELRSIVIWLLFSKLAHLGCCMIHLVDVIEGVQRGHGCLMVM
jgi:hypothetical protein